MTFLLVAAVFAALPLVVFRGRTLRRYYACYAASWALFLGLAAITQSLRIAVDPYLCLVTFAVIQLTIFSIFLAGKDVLWSANRAAVIALLVYALAIPAMTHHVPDGDEPHYLLMTASLVRDHDLDLANQFRDLAHSGVGRLDLRPQLGDRTGAHGEIHSHLEPLLAFLLIPGYLAAGLFGALATMALFGALLARSTVRLFEDAMIDDATTRALFPLIAFGPPILFYATRIWPEVPGAWMFVEAVRGVDQRRTPRWIGALLALVMLKLRFALIAVVLVVRALRTRKQAIAATLIIALPALLLSTTTHRLRELIPSDATMWLQGFFGLLVDAHAGIAFVAPIFLGGVVALARWRSTPPAFRLGISASALYIFTLVARPEWHGGWSPPLRYIVVFMPILALGAAALAKPLRGWFAPVVLWTIVVAVHGLSAPWRLFHIADGQNFVGEYLDDIWQSDFGRLLPSLIRPNLAAFVASALLVLVCLFVPKPNLKSSAIIVAIAMALFFQAGRKPGSRIEFEDAHVSHDAGELFPYEYTVARFRYRGGWIIRPGEKLSFLARGGVSTIEYQSEGGAAIELAGRVYELPPTVGYGRARVEIPRSGRVFLRCVRGAVNLDRMDHE
jgi:hypothetical protein